jgi:hypothetical protein
MGVLNAHLQNKESVMEKDPYEHIPRQKLTLKDVQESVHLFPKIDILIVEVCGGPLDGTVKIFREISNPMVGQNAQGCYGVCTSEDFPEIEKFLESHLTKQI